MNIQNGPFPNGLLLPPNELVVFDCEPADILKWLEKTFGPRRPKNSKWTYRTYGDWMWITFSDPKYKEWFLLRWA